MTGKLHPLAPATPTKDRPEEAPATPEAVKVEPQLAGGESWGDGLEAIKTNNVVVGLNLIQPAESHACRPARASDEDLNESREADVVVEAPLGPYSSGARCLLPGYSANERAARFAWANREARNVW